MSNRIEKVNSLLEQEIGKAILKDFDFSGTLVTLTHVEATPNLIEAKAYVSVFPEEKTQWVLKVLNGQVQSIQQKINKKLNMRPIPRILFVGDEKIKEAARVEELLSKLKKGEN